MPSKGKPSSDKLAAHLVQAARRIVGDDGSPLTAEEKAVIAKIKVEHGRPSKAEIRALAKRLAGGQD